MKKYLIPICVLAILFSCKFEKHIKIEYGKKNCEKKEIDAVYINQSFTKYDTCNRYKGKFYRKYFVNKKLTKEGYSKRYSKEGIWRFYDKNGDTITKVSFNNSELTGITKFKNLDTISWEIFTLPDKGFKISKPKKWIVLEENEGLYTFNDKNGHELPNISVDIQMHLVDDIEEKIIDIYNATVEQKKKYDKVNNLKHKKLSIQLYEESYEISNEENIDGKTYLVNEIIYVYKGRFYYLQLVVDKKSKYDYKIIKEIIKSSFKVYDTIIPNKTIKFLPN